MNETLLEMIFLFVIFTLFFKVIGEDMGLPWE